MSQISASRTASTPLHFWALAVLGVAYFSYAGWQFYLMQTQNPEYMAGLPAEQAELLVTFPTSFFVILWVVALTGLIGCFLLLFRRPTATQVLLAAVTFAVVHELQVHFFLAPPSVPRWLLMLSTVLFILPPAVLWGYARAMERRGVLG